MRQNRKALRFFQHSNVVLLENFHRLGGMLRAVHPLRRVPSCVSQHRIAAWVLIEVRCNFVNLSACREVGGGRRGEGSAKGCVYKHILNELEAIMPSQSKLGQTYQMMSLVCPEHSDFQQV